MEDDRSDLLRDSVC